MIPSKTCRIRALRGKGAEGMGKEVSGRMLFLCLAILILPLVASARETPNIVFILADDLGYGDVGCYGAPDLRTPNIDRIAAEGIRFTDFYANGAVCSPTRIAFLTGRYQQRFGMENALNYQEFGRGLPVDGKTIAHRLREAGYATGLSGKWHLGYDHERKPLQQGFDSFFGLLSGNHHYFEHMDRVGVADLWRGNELIEREGYTTDLITEDAVGFIESNRERPFFLYLSHAAPHFPWQGPDDADKLVQPNRKNWQEGDRETYVAMVERMDRGIGEVLEKLDSLGLAENTLVIFTSDNGGHTYSRNTPLRDYKSTLWEGGIRVPCVARWPGRIAEGVTTGQVAITMDWTATFASLAGAEMPALDGIDLTPVLTGETGEIERTLFWRRRPGPRRKGIPIERAVREGKWKRIEPENEKPMLFDLEADISETRDVSSEHLEILEVLGQKLDAWEKDVGE